MREERLEAATHVALLVQAGLDSDTAGFVAALDTGIGRGDCDVDDHRLSQLLRRPTASFLDGLRADAPYTGRVTTHTGSTRRTTSAASSRWLP